MAAKAGNVDGWARCRKDRHNALEEAEEKHMGCEAED